MINFLESISLFVIFNLVSAKEPLVQKSVNFFQLAKNAETTHISPEIIKELKDFENLIPTSTVEEIAAKHALFDGNFRRVVEYLKSEDFTQLQKQILSVPEIIDVLVFLHLTAENATTMHMGATAGKRDAASLNEYDEAAAAAVADSSYKSIDKMTTELTKPQNMAAAAAAVNVKVEETVNNLKLPKRPQQQFFYITENSNKYVGLDKHVIDGDDGYVESINANSIAFSEQQSLVDIVLLEDLEVKAKDSNEGQLQQQQHEQHQHHQHQHKYKSHSSLGTFTSFVEEVLQHLPNYAYQKMITDKCRNNLKFAKFYQALRSPILKPYIEGLKLKPSLQTIIQNLNSHEVDVNGLEAIAFKVISWGPNL